MSRKYRKYIHTLPFVFANRPTSVLCSVLKEAGLPAGVVNMIFGIGKE